MVGNGVETDPVVEYPQSALFPCNGYLNGDLCRGGVTNGVRQRLLGDPIEAQGDLGCHMVHLAVGDKDDLWATRTPMCFTEGVKRVVNQLVVK